MDLTPRFIESQFPTPPQSINPPSAMPIQGYPPVDPENKSVPLPVAPKTPQPNAPVAQVPLTRREAFRQYRQGVLGRLRDNAINFRPASNEMLIEQHQPQDYIRQERARYV